MLEGAWERALSVANPSDCFVVAGSAQAALIRQCLTDLPEKNLLIEPEPRDTSGAVAYALGGVLRNLQGQSADKSVMLVLPGDHIISPVNRFAETTVTGAIAAVQLDALVTYGIVPRHPATGYGYIQRGDAVQVANAPAQAPAVYRVKNFKEKPDLQTAKAYVASGEYFWNGGIFLYPLNTLQSELQRQLPGHADMAKQLGQSTTPADWDRLARQFFPTLKKISIDFGIMEHAKTVATVAADFSWDDIGSWSAVAANLAQPTGNATDADSQVIPIDAKNNLVFAPGKRVAIVGVEGLAVVVSGNEILVCRLDRDQDVKKVSEMAQNLNKLPG